MILFCKCKTQPLCIICGYQYINGSKKYEQKEYTPEYSAVFYLY